MLHRSVPPREFPIDQFLTSRLRRLGMHLLVFEMNLLEIGDVISHEAPSHILVQGLVFFCFRAPLYWNVIKELYCDVEDQSLRTLLITFTMWAIKFVPPCGKVYILLSDKLNMSQI